MTIITNAIYKNGVFKPTQHINFSPCEKVYLLAIPQKEWKTQFTKLLKKVYQRTKKYSSSEIEKDITYAFNKLQRNK
ncbi:MAG: antitoxin family protein [Elusimicrobiota bacterium]